MRSVPLGDTGIAVSAVAFGAGPIPELMTAESQPRQRETVEQALAAGINWFDTAATYGMGRSEESLGRVLAELDAAGDVHVATKVRLMPPQLDDIAGHVETSLMESLARLRVERVTLLQLHNSVTGRRGEEPTSITPADVLGSGGVLQAAERLREKGLVGHLGLTGIGQPTALREVIASGRFATIQVPYNLLNPSAGSVLPSDFPETNYGNVIDACAQQRMGVLAIRVYAGGAIVGQPPAPHTFRTPFFPLDLFRRDVIRAQRLAATVAGRLPLAELALRYVVGHPQIDSAIVGFSSPAQVVQAVSCLDAGPLAEPLLQQLEGAWRIPPESGDAASD